MNFVTGRFVPLSTGEGNCAAKAHVSVQLQLPPEASVRHAVVLDSVVVLTCVNSGSSEER